ncbi:MAG: hypothetical protein IKH67_04340, partial [Lachnospiraceae bacterium]|nr:hypothetical protein [Lachnospiraceae bacterium]
SLKADMDSYEFGNRLQFIENNKKIVRFINEIRDAYLYAGFFERRKLEKKIKNLVHKSDEVNLLLTAMQRYHKGMLDKNHFISCFSTYTFVFNDPEPLRTKEIDLLYYCVDDNYSTYSLKECANIIFSLKNQYESRKIYT